MVSCLGASVPSFARVSTSELAVLAAALDAAPVELLYPFATGTASFLPGCTAPPWDAARWWSGEASLKDGKIGGHRRRGPAGLYQDHATVLAELADAEITEDGYASLRRRQFGTPKLSDRERAQMMAVVALTEIREQLREGGLDLPPLPPALKWLDG